MRYPQYPESDCSQAIGQVISMIQEDIGLITCGSIMKANKIRHIDMATRILVKRLCEDRLTCQQLFDIHSLLDNLAEAMHGRLDIIIVCMEAPALQIPVLLPDLLDKLAPLK